MINVAVDGPAGAGKSTIARAAAAELGYIYVDTGALYRAVGVYALEHDIPTSDAEAITGMLGGVDVTLRFVDGAQQVLLNGRDVSTEIRTPAASMAASAVSAVPAVRDFLFETQRAIAREHSCIMDGRDIGTVVLPDAQVKVFLTASPELRARRRYDELIAKGQTVEFKDVLDELLQRDYNDSHRAVAPLRPAPDGVILDNSDLDLPASVAALVAIIKEKTNG
ncbi:MAG: (d)CMP kinase [Clostridia bacterium]|nr:(d)CMP kinase [Clostridia bacterium]